MLIQFFRKTHSVNDEKNAVGLLGQCLSSPLVGSGAGNRGTLIEVLEKLNEVEGRINKLESPNKRLAEQISPRLQTENGRFRADTLDSRSSR